MSDEEDGLSYNDIDFVSGLSYTSLNYIFDCYVPVQLAYVAQNDVDSCNYDDGIMVSKTALERLSFNFNIIPRDPTTSAYEGCFNNVDSLLINDKEAFDIPGTDKDSRGYNIVGHIETSKTHAGYLKVKSPKGCCPYALTDSYLSADVFKKNGIHAPCNLRTNDQPSDMSSDLLTVENQLKRTNLSSERSTKNVVTAFPCLSWPEEASKFATRERSTLWPDKTVISEIMKHGCLVVPCAHPSSCQPDIEWKYSFLNAEMKLVESLNDFQVQAYLLFQLICEQGLDLPSILTSGHLKTVFFWTCEKLSPEFWCGNNIANCVLFLIDMLLHFLISGCIPDYFVPSWNTIDHVSDDFVRELSARVSSIRRNVLQPLLEFDARFRMPYWPRTIKMVDILKPVLNCTVSSLASEEIASKVIKAGSRFVITLLKEPLFATGHKESESKMKNDRFKYATYALQRLEKAIAEPNRGLDFYVGMAKESGELYIPFLEYLLDRFPADSSAAVHQGNLACYYYNQARKAPDPNLKLDLTKKANNHFQKALKQDNCSDATKVDYANFLFHEKEFSEGIALLKAVIKRRNFSAWNSYNEEEFETLDPDIQNEIKTFKNLTLPSVAMAYYLLLSYCHRSSPPISHEESLQYFLDFKDVCSLIFNIFGKHIQTTKPAVATCFILLGICAQLVEEFDMSSQAFAKALEIIPDHPTALIRKQVVDSLIEAIALSQ